MALSNVQATHHRDTRIQTLAPMEMTLESGTPWCDVSNLQLAHRVYDFTQVTEMGSLLVPAGFVPITCG